MVGGYVPSDLAPHLDITWGRFEDGEKWSETKQNSTNYNTNNMVINGSMELVFPIIRIPVTGG